MGKSFSKMETYELAITYPEQVSFKKAGRKVYGGQEYLYYKPTKKYIFNSLINSDTMVFSFNKDKVNLTMSIYTSPKYFNEICNEKGKIFESKQIVNNQSTLIIRVDTNGTLKEVVHLSNLNKI